MKKKILAILIAVFIAAIGGVSGQVASGGVYKLEQVVTANGGGTASGDSSAVEGTIGQPIAGPGMSGGTYFLRGGFWTPVPFSPSAARATIGGRVVHGENIGIKNVRVTMIGGNMTAPRVSYTNPSGDYLFEDVEVGRTYLVSVAHNKYYFAEPLKFVNLFDSIADLAFVGSPAT